MAKRRRKTKASKSCPSGRRFASGRKKGHCVPKVKRGRKGKSWCYAKTRDDAIQRLQLYEKRKAAAAAMRAKVLARKEEAWRQRYSDEGGWEEKSALQGVGRRRHRRRR